MAAYVLIVVALVMGNQNHDRPVVIEVAFGSKDQCEVPLTEYRKTTGMQVVAGGCYLREVKP